MNLTFKGFLRSYYRELTGLQTDSLKKLCAAAADGSPAAAEAIMVFAAIQGKAPYLVALSRGTWMEKDYEAAASCLGAPEEVASFLQSECAPQRYQKVWSAYVAKRDAVLTDRRVIDLMRRKILTAMEQRGLTGCRICEELGLNKGNVYAFLGKGDSSKVSRATARRILEYVGA